MKILITAGPTREFIDPVRFISNPATGTLGYLMAKEAKKKGHSVVLVSGPCNLPLIKDIKTLYVESACEMKNAVEKEFSSSDVLVMTAAVSDWRPEKRFSRKLKIKKPWKLKLVPNPDILKFISNKKNEKQIVVGFALESENIIENARKKMKDKKLDMIVANTTANFGNRVRRGQIFILYSSGEIKDVSDYSKKKLASLILKEVEKLCYSG